MKKTVLLMVVALSIIGFITLLLQKNPVITDPEPAAVADKALIRVVSDAPGAPAIPGARIVGLLPQGPLQAKTDREGRAEVPRGETVQLRILAPKHVGLQLTLDLSQADQTIVLKRTGSVRLQALDIGGRPVEGVVFRLVASAPEPSMILLGQEPEKTTDAEGVARWTNLPPDAKAEWSCASGHVLTPVDQGIVEVVGGQESGVSLRVQPSTTVFFRLDPGRFAGGMARVEVTSDREVERTLEVAVGAPVSIPNLTPGEKRVRAAWWDAPGMRAYATTAFVVEHLETHDIGLLRPRSGESVEVRVRIDAPPDKAKAIIKPAMARLRLATEAGYDDPPLVDEILVEAGRVYRLKGIPATRMTFSCVPDFKFEPGTPVPKIEPVPQVEVSIPSPRVEIAIKVS